MERSLDRIRSLSSGTLSTYSGPPARRGGLPEESHADFAELRASFIDGTDAVLAVLTLADPVAGRLQRVFGVSQLKVDPTFTSGSDLPQARVTLQQNVTNHITFTYVTALNDPNTQIIRVEWALNQQWSAVAARDQNGMFGINFFYKKQFR